MRVCVAIASRGRPRQAGAVVELLRCMQSGMHEVRYVVSCDLDDHHTQDFFSSNGYEVDLSVEPRPTGLGRCWNRVPAQYEAEIYLFLGDDAFVPVPSWDALACQVMLQVEDCRQFGIFCLPDMANPEQATMFCFTPRWIDLTGPQVLDERFPFWFSDTAINETYQFITGHGLVCAQSFLTITPPGTFNPRLRDLDLWWDLFAATRQERLRTAERVRDRLGLPVPANLPKMLADMGKRDADGKASIEGIMATIKRPSAVTPEYEQAKAAAIEYLRTRGSELAA